MLDTVANGSSAGSSASRPPPLLASSSSLTTTTPGESFIDLGVSLSTAGGAGRGSGVSGSEVMLEPNDKGAAKSPSKRVGVILEPSMTTLCMGLMSSAKFCTRLLTEGNATCGAASHSRKFQPPPNAAFVKDTEVRALCQPVLDLSGFTPAQRLRIQGVHLTSGEWILLFQQVRQRNPPKWLSFDDSPTITVDTLVSSPSIEILSPTHATGGIMSLIPMLSSFDDSTASEDEPGPGMELAEVVSYIRKFKSHFASLKGKWSKAFTEVESGYSLLVQDLKNLQSVTQDQVQALGHPVDIAGCIPESVWQGLSVIQETVQEATSNIHAQASSLNALAVDQTAITHSVLALEGQAEEISASMDTQVASLTSDLRALESRVLRLVPLLTQLKRGPAPNSAVPSGDSNHLALTAKVANCEQALILLREKLESLPSAQSPDPFPRSSAVDSSIRELQAQMKQLQLKVVGKGVQIANKTFQTFEDVRTWVDTHLPNHRYGLFVDGVSIFEFFTAGHVDAETTYSVFYSQHRTGFKSTFEARIASSVQNLFPSVFGKSDSNLDTAEALPALPTPERWDSNDGNTGLRYQIMRNMSDVELQLQETISTVLGDYPEAQHIARECLHQSKRFALELSQFITLDFQKWKHRGHSKRDAWKMTAVCVRRIFEELYSERVVARDVYDQGNPSFTTGKYLWATWKAHSVMTKYLRHQFYEHPSISAVLARHLADNYVKPDDMQATKIKSLESQVKALEGSLQTLQSRYDTLRVAGDKTKTEQTEKKSHDKDWKGKNGKGNPVPGSG